MATDEFVLTDTDLAPLEGFPLLWRWTDPKHIVLPAEDIAEIRPLSATAAQKANSLAKSFIHDSSDRLSSALFGQCVECDTSGDPDDGRRWLKDVTRAFQPSLDVIITWTSELAVATTLRLFVKYWDDFCYPMSDDTTIFPFDVKWAIQFWNEEVLYFANRKPPAE